VAVAAAMDVTRLQPGLIAGVVLQKRHMLVYIQSAHSLLMHLCQHPVAAAPLPTDIKLGASLPKLLKAEGAAQQTIQKANRYESLLLPPCRPPLVSQQQQM
jgi:hypothetical protein